MYPTVEPEPKKLAIGDKDGFRPDEMPWKEKAVSQIYIHKDGGQYFDLDSFPIDFVTQCAKCILDSTSAEMKAEIASWQPDAPAESKYARELVQLDNGVKIPPESSKWKCSRCELTNNLWLNISDGTLLCGRKNWDGSGGNGHALDHYNDTKYPLCVKLGTITGDGADVFSYAEDDMVTDSLLDQHLK